MPPALARSTSSGRISAALPSRPIDTGFLARRVLRDQRQRVVDVRRLLVEIARAQAEVDAATAGTRCRATTAPASVAASGCAPPMPPRPAVRIHLPAEVAAVVLAAGFGEGLVGALHDALAADVDPAAGRHLAVHHQALAVELVEVLPGRPLRHEVRVGDQHARRVGMRLEHADRLARLDQQRLVVVQLAQRGEDLRRSRPSCARRGRCRRRRPGPAGSRRLRGRGCSAACGAAPR